MRAIFLVAAVFAAACATSTEPARAQQSAPAAVAAQRFTLDPVHTQVAFSVERFGFNHVLGRFDAIAGEVSLDQANPAASSVTATIQVGSLNTGDATRDGHLKGEIWLNAAQFPTMEFRSTGVQRTGDNTADVAGNMTIRGVTHPVTLHVRLNRTGPNPANRANSAGFSATTTISRTAFGVGAPRVPTTLIGDDVVITIEALGQAAAN